VGGGAGCFACCRQHIGQTSSQKRCSREIGKELGIGRQTGKDVEGNWEYKKNIIGNRKTDRDRERCGKELGI
jgi:hypothetical protein